MDKKTFKDIKEGDIVYYGSLSHFDVEERTVRRVSVVKKGHYEDGYKLIEVSGWIDNDGFCFYANDNDVYYIGNQNITSVDKSVVIKYLDEEMTKNIQSKINQLSEYINTVQAFRSRYCNIFY